MDILQLLLNIFLATLPALFWLWWYLRKDRAEPEPKRFLWRVFLLGALVTIPALFLEYVINLAYPFSSLEITTASTIGAFLIIAPIEELAKFFVVYASVYRHKVFNQRIDGVIYMIVAALGFATVENILVVISEGAAILPIRFVTATLLHALASGIIGHFLGLAKFGKRAKAGLITLGLIVGIFLHGLYDFLAIYDSPVKLSVLLLFMAAVFVLLDLFVRNSQKRDAASTSSRDQD